VKLVEDHAADACQEGSVAQHHARRGKNDARLAVRHVLVSHDVADPIAQA
jgi:hypothetical protein